MRESSLRHPAGGARKTVRAYADPRVFRPLRKLRVGPRDSCGAGSRTPCRNCHSRACFATARQWRGCGNCGLAFPATGSARPQTPCGARKTVRAYADPPVFRPLRKLRAPCIRRRRREPSILNNSKFGWERLFFDGNLWYSVPIEKGIANTAECAEGESCGAA